MGSNLNHKAASLGHVGMNTQDCLAGEKNADMYETAQPLELGYGSGLHFWCHLRLPAFEEVIFSL